MTRLLIHVEGETEESFVNKILAPHLYAFGYESVGARLVGNSRQRDRRGGIKPWSAVKNDILSVLRGDSGCLATTMVDYYALPQSGDRAWPGRAEAGNLAFSDKAVTVEKAIHADILNALGAGFNPNRFIPFVTMHEFEGLLFSDCAAFSQGIERPELVSAFQAVRNQFGTPEEINDSPMTAPSKRVAELVVGYQKRLHGTFAAQEIGLVAIRRECPHFNDWLSRLEGHNKNV